MIDTIGIISGKGGVGKTTTAINLAATLTDFNVNTTLVDANIKNPNVALHLDLRHIPIALQHSLHEGVDITHTIRIHHTGLKIVPSAINYDSEVKANLGNLKEILKGLDGTIVLDSPPGLTEDTEHIIKASNKIFVVTTPDIPAVTEATKTIKLVRKNKKSVDGLIVNKVKNDSFDLTQDEIEIMCETPVISKIPQDDNIRRSIFENLPVRRYNPYSKAAIEFNYLSARLMNRTYEEPNLLFLRRMIRF